MYHNSDYRLQTGCGFIIGLLLIFWVVSGLFSYAKQFYEERQLLPTPITGSIVSYELYRDYEHTIKDKKKAYNKATAGLQSIIRVVIHILISFQGRFNCRRGHPYS